MEFLAKQALGRKDSNTFLVIYHSNCVKSASKSIYTASKFTSN